jgi:FkbM family methyltransferase
MKGIFFENFKNSYIPHILKESYIDQAYEPYFRGKKDLTIVDVGANIGLTSFYFYDYAKVVYALEPSEQHMKVLKHMIAFNKMDDRIIPIKKALSHKNGTANFYHNENVTMFSLNSAVNSKDDKEEVETITFDSFFKENNITHVDFLKLDVEGSEHEIIGSEGFDKVADKIDVIMGEHHVWSGRNPEQFRAAFIDRGFDFMWIPNEAQLFVAKHR